MRDRKRIDFKTYEEYNAWVEGLPAGAVFDESDEDVENGRFSYLIVELEDESYEVHTPAREFPVELLGVAMVVRYRCSCGEEDNIRFLEDELEASNRGCCGVLVTAKLLNGNVELSSNRS